MPAEKASVFPARVSLKGLPPTQPGQPNCLSPDCTPTADHSLIASLPPDYFCERNLVVGEQLVCVVGIHEVILGNSGPAQGLESVCYSDKADFHYLHAGEAGEAIRG